VTWYDQSGNAYNATQSTSNAQPKIYDGGSQTLIKRLNKPAITNEGRGSTSKLQATLSSSITDFTLFIVTEQQFESDDSISETSFELSSGKNNRHLISASKTTNGDHRYFEGNSTNYASGFTGSNLHYVNHIGTDVTAGVNGNTGLNASLSDPGDADTIYLLNDSTDSNQGATVSEVILYDSDQSSKRSDIEDDINEYFKIYGILKTSAVATPLTSEEQATAADTSTKSTANADTITSSEVTNTSESSVKTNSAIGLSVTTEASKAAIAATTNLLTASATLLTTSESSTTSETVTKTSITASVTSSTNSISEIEPLPLSSFRRYSGRFLLQTLD